MVTVVGMSVGAGPLAGDDSVPTSTTKKPTNSLNGMKILPPLLRGCAQRELLRGEDQAGRARACPPWADTRARTPKRCGMHRKSLAKIGAQSSHVATPLSVATLCARLRLERRRLCCYRTSRGVK